jgi:hypothetical protein
MGGWPVVDHEIAGMDGMTCDCCKVLLYLLAFLYLIEMVLSWWKSRDES